MKKAFFLITLVAVAAFLLITYIFGWVEFRRNKDTSDAFLSRVIVKKTMYSKDSALLVKAMRRFIETHDESFDATVYNNSTQVIIDTIVYGPDLKKMAALVLAKVPANAYSDPRYSFFYDGFGYFGYRLNDSVDVAWRGQMLVGFHERSKISEGLRTYFFNRLAMQKDTGGQYQYKYNVNDYRFWSCPLWKEVDTHQSGKKQFEEEKKNYPENIYEPKYPLQGC